MRVYRPARPVVWTFGFLAVLSACYFGWAAIMLSVRALQAPDEWLAASLILEFLAALTSVFPCLWIFVLAQKIVGHGLWITFIGPFRKRTIHLRDVTGVRWHNNDSVTLLAGRCRQRYWFGSYSVEDAADLVKLIRNNVPAALHAGWHPFYQARMKGRLDRHQLFLLRNPRANPNPQPIKVGRLLLMSLGTSFPIALAFWGLIQWHLRHVEDAATSPLTENSLLFCLSCAAAANVAPLLLVFVELFRLRRQRLTWETTGIEYA